ncbi:MAG: hypothetical protein ACFFED_08475 [Candidatus Thorarchaeota archaeon]
MGEYFKAGAYPWALTGIFAALHLVITLIPFSLSVSGTGAISFGMISAAIVGYLLGPFYGTLSVLIGSYIGIFINPEIAVIGLTTPIATAAGALAAGLIRIKKAEFVVGIYIVAMVAYLVGPIGILVPEALWFHVIVFLFSLLLVLPFTKKRLNNEIGLSKSTSTRALFLVVLIAVCVDQAVGSAIGSFYLIYVAGLDIALVSTFWVAVVFVYPVERIIGALIATFILATLIESISSGYFRLPGTPAEEDLNQELEIE